MWTAQQEKITVAVAAGITGYSVISNTVTTLPQLPAFISNPLVYGISLLTVAAGLSIYGAITLLRKY